MKRFLPALMVLAIAAVAGCGSRHDLPTSGTPTSSSKVATTSAERIAVVDKALVAATSAGARENARAINVQTNAAQKWIQVSAACTGGGSLDVIVHVDGKTAPFSPSCNSPSDGTVAASIRVTPNSGYYGTVVVTVTRALGQTWWIGAGATTRPAATP